MNKKCLLCLMIGVLLFMSSCSRNDNNECFEGTGRYTTNSSKEYILNIKVGEGAIEKDFVSDAQTAQTIGDAIIRSTVGNEFDKLIEVSVAFDSKEKIWIINRRLGKDVLGGDYSCAINQSDGKIIKVWAGE